VRREGSFHGDHPFHGILEAYRYAFGAGFAGVMSIAEEAVPRALGARKVMYYLKYRRMAI
jgi:hypothetical protein